MHLEKKLCIKKRSLVRGGGTLMLAGGSEDGFFRVLNFRGCPRNWTMHYRVRGPARHITLVGPFELKNHLTDKPFSVEFKAERNYKCLKRIMSEAQSHCSASFS
jgi:hypothetical protein